MEFEWDKQKRITTIAQHGVDFRDAVLIFEGPVITRIDDRKDYGELRLISVGMVGNTCYVVVHTPRGDKTRLITAWQGGQHEREQHRASISGRAPEDEERG